MIIKNCSGLSCMNECGGACMCKEVGKGEDVVWGNVLGFLNGGWQRSFSRGRCAGIPGWRVAEKQ